jgi:hypothetical protein
VKDVIEDVVAVTASFLAQLTYRFKLIMRARQHESMTLTLSTINSICKRLQHGAVSLQCCCCMALYPGRANHLRKLDFYCTMPNEERDYDAEALGNIACGQSHRASIMGASFNAEFRGSAKPMNNDHGSKYRLFSLGHSSDAPFGLKQNIRDLDCIGKPPTLKRRVDASKSTVPAKTIKLDGDQAGYPSLTHSALSLNSQLRSHKPARNLKSSKSRVKRRPPMISVNLASPDVFLQGTSTIFKGHVSGSSMSTGTVTLNSCNIEGLDRTVKSSSTIYTKHSNLLSQSAFTEEHLEASSLNLQNYAQCSVGSNPDVIVTSSANATTTCTTTSHGHDSNIFTAYKPGQRTVSSGKVDNLSPTSIKSDNYTAVGDPNNNFKLEKNNFWTSDSPVYSKCLSEKIAARMYNGSTPNLATRLTGETEFLSEKLASLSLYDERSAQNRGYSPTSPQALIAHAHNPSVKIHTTNSRKDLRDRKLNASLITPATEDSEPERVVTKTPNSLANHDRYTQEISFNTLEQLMVPPADNSKLANIERPTKLGVPQKASGLVELIQEGEKFDEVSIKEQIGALSNTERGKKLHTLRTKIR